MEIGTDIRGLGVVRHGHIPGIEKGADILNTDGCKASNPLVDGLQTEISIDLLLLAYPRATDRFSPRNKSL